ncbi:hypothetical protein HanRHA438_Chr02g0081871 [Helianthus annuus]|nr:hypothetical protein HanRHA438_Chr02g0081871 [Helianthus annuus]
MFADWFEICNLPPPLTVFMVDLLEYYNIHICHLSPLGMVRARHFEYTFRAQNMIPLVEDFRRFYQMMEKLGFFSFSLRYGATMLMIAPKGLSKWKAKFFYVKAAAVTTRFHFRKLTDTISIEQLNTPELRETSLASAPASYPFQQIGKQGVADSVDVVAGKPG